MFFQNKPKQWDVDLPQVEFAFNNMCNRSTSKTLFKIVYTKPPKHALDLVPLPKLLGLSVAARNMAKRIQNVQTKVGQSLEQANSKYKVAANKHGRVKIFQEGDLVMVHLCKNRFPNWNRPQTEEPQVWTVPNREEDQRQCLCCGAS